MSTTEPASVPVCKRNRDGLCQSAIDNGDQGCTTHCEMAAYLTTPRPATREAEPATPVDARNALQMAVDHIDNLQECIDDLVKFGATVAICGSTYDRAFIDAALARQAAAPASTAEFYELYERSVL